MFIHFSYHHTKDRDKVCINDHICNISSSHFPLKLKHLFKWSTLIITYASLRTFFTQKHRRVSQSNFCWSVIHSKIQAAFEMPSCAAARAGSVSVQARLVFFRGRRRRTPFRRLARGAPSSHGAAEGQLLTQPAKTVSTWKPALFPLHYIS